MTKTIYPTQNCKTCKIADKCHIPQGFLLICGHPDYNPATFKDVMIEEQQTVKNEVK